MSFSSEIKEKLVKVQNEFPIYDIYELAGFMGNAAKITGDSILLVTENLTVASGISDIINKIYLKNIKPQYNSKIYKIKITDREIISKIIADTKHLKNELKTKDEFCMGAYARGAFLGGGSITNPEKSYHMEFDYKDEVQAGKLKEIFKNNTIEVKTTKRKNHTVLYIKDYQMIAGVLGFIGAGGAAMDIYNISAEKEIRNGINRQMNCENANMDKVALAYSRHLKAIKKIGAQKGLDKLPDILRETAMLRMKYPEDSLSDLGKRFNPPIGKSGVNHRLTRIMDIADNL